MSSRGADIGHAGGERHRQRLAMGGARPVCLERRFSSRGRIGTWETLRALPHAAHARRSRGVRSSRGTPRLSSAARETRHFHQHGRHWRCGECIGDGSASVRPAMPSSFPPGDVGRHGNVPSWRCAKAPPGKPPWKAIAPRWRRRCFASSMRGLPIHCMKRLARGGLASALGKSPRPPAWLANSPRTDSGARHRASGLRRSWGGTRCHVANEGRSWHS